MEESRREREKGKTRGSGINKESEQKMGGSGEEDARYGGEDQRISREDRGKRRRKGRRRQGRKKKRKGRWKI